MNRRSGVLIRVFLVLGIFLSLTGGLSNTVSAITTCTWDGNVSTDWFNAENWSCGEIPLSTEYDVIIPVVVTPYYPKLDSFGVRVNSIIIHTGAELVIDTSTQIGINSASFVNNGTINIIDNAYSKLYIYGGVFNNLGTVNIGNNQSWLILQGLGTHSGDFIGNQLNFNQAPSRQLNTFSPESTIDVRKIYVLGNHDIDINGSFDCSFDFTIRNDSHVTISTDGIIDVGNVTVEDTSELNFRITGGSFDPGETLDINSGESLVGEGTIQANLVNAGTVSPGTSPGTISVHGNYTQDPAGTLSIELGGTNPGNNHDQLVVTGTTALEGTLNVSLINSFTPILGNSFTIMTYASQTGVFSDKVLPSLSAGLVWQVEYQGSALLLRVVEMGSISGTVTYIGDKGNNALTLALFEDPSNPPIETIQVNNTTGDYPYSFANLINGTYFVGALMDLNNNDHPDPNEPFAWYDAAADGNPDQITLTNGNQTHTGIDFILDDPASISGTVSYFGTLLISGPIKVSAHTSLLSEPLASAADISSGETYLIEGLPAGNYFISAYLDTGDDGGPPLADEPFAWYDADNDGAPDTVEIQGGNVILSLDIDLTDPFVQFYLPLILH